MKAHAAVAAELLEDCDFVDAVLQDFRTATLDDRGRALFAFLEKVNQHPAEIDAADVSAVRAAGWSDEALYDAITVCALFNFYNRWVDASGVHPMSDEAHKLAAVRMAASGYVRTPQE